jgi:3-methyl-2-oxobutanoate hydroxymethyltransferase
MENEKWTTRRIKELKGRSRIVSLTAYDYITARLVDEAGLHIVLVGDSLAMTVLGYKDTLPVTLEEMLHHTRAVVRGVRHALVVADMPFLSYQVSDGEAIDNAGRFLKEGGADTVKIEGGAFRASTIRALTDNGIPVMGHIGLNPQHVRELGGYRVQGKTDKAADELKKDAKALEDAGVFSIVLESMPSELGGEITQSVGVPTIGIGAGADCDGQVLVVHDLLGMYPDFKPRYVKRYAEMGDEMKRAFSAFKRDVENGSFPGPEQSY